MSIDNWTPPVFLFCVFIPACGERYCQYGAKYGTTCPTMSQVEWQETQVRPEPPIERSTQPAPGCALLTGNGIYIVPPQGGPAPNVPPAYLMSGACVSRRQPAYGAIR